MLVMFALWIRGDEDRRVRMALRARRRRLLIRRRLERQRLIVLLLLSGALYLEHSKQASEHLDEIKVSSNGL